MTQLSFDTETKGLDAFAPDEGPFLATWSDARGNDHLAHVDDARAMAAFESDLRASDVLIAHNLPFDAHQLREHCDIDVLELGVKLVDTANLARVVLPERRFEEGYDLESLSRSYLPEEDQKLDLAAKAKDAGIKLKTKGGYYAYWQHDPVGFEDYAKQDTRATIELLPALADKVDDGLRPTWELERDVQPHLIRAEARGVCVDQEKVEDLHATYTAKRDVAYEAVTDVLGSDALGDPDDPEQRDSPEAMRQALLDHGVALHRTTQKTGELTVNAAALSEFKTQFPVIERIFEYRKAAKFLSTYIEPMLGREVVHTNFNQIGAWTGRMSSSRPNLQNIPVRGEGSSELRAMFVPRPGHVFVASDFDQIELRLLAYYLNDAGFKARIEAGDDVFSELAAELAPIRLYADKFGVDPSSYRKGTPGGELYRSDSKNGTYAICYGVGAPKLSDMLGLPPGPPRGPNDWAVQRGYKLATDPSYPVGTKVIKTVKSWLPGYDGLMSTRRGQEGRIIRKVRALGHVSTINGRRQHIGRDKEYVGLAGLIQGSAADIMKLAVIAVADAIAPLGGQPVLFVHDEIVSEVPLEYAEEALRLQDAAMESAWDLSPRLSVGGTIARNNYSEGK